LSVPGPSPVSGLSMAAFMSSSPTFFSGMTPSFQLREFA
jgi:hypothetical protein